MGSKSRHAKELLSIMMKHRKDQQYFVDPFVGGANVVDKVSGNVIASDINPYLMCMWKAVSEEGWIPPKDISEVEYKQIRDNKDLLPITAYAGFALSYAGKFFGGYSKDNIGKRNYSHEAYRNAMIQFPKLSHVRFFHTSYDQLKIPNNSIIYCDPPYSNTTKYSGDKFDTPKFWEWCENKVKEGHAVYVSEYTAPDGWDCVWEKNAKNYVSKKDGYDNVTERLYLKGE